MMSLARKFALIFILALSIMPTAVRADFSQCAKLATLFNLNDVKKAAAFVAEHGQCIGDLTRPDFLAVVAAVVLIEQMTGAFHDGAGCEAALGNVAAKPIALAIAELASILNLPENVKNELIAFASEEGAEQFLAFMNNTPGLDIIAGNWACACAVRYSGIAEKLKEILENLAGCTGGVIESGLDGVGNFYDSMFGGAGHAATGQVEQTVVAICQPGWNKGSTTWSYKAQSAVSVPVCDCPPPSTQIKNPNANSYACQCPPGFGYVASTVEQIQYAADGKGTLVSVPGGKCAPCSDSTNAFVSWSGQCVTCTAGQKPGSTQISNEKTCVPACPPGAIFSGDKCTPCPAGTYAYTVFNSSLGQCKSCPPNETSLAGATSCFPKCKEWERWDPASGSCKPLCPPGKRWFMKNEFNYACASCADGEEYVPSKNICSKCPDTMVWVNKDGVGRCECNSGTVRQGNLCIPLAAGKIAPSENMTTDVDAVAPKSCPTGWTLSARQGKCVPGLKVISPPASRNTPTPSRSNDPGTGRPATIIDPPSSPIRGGAADYSVQGKP